jgi:hypothetical protein
VFATTFKIKHPLGKKMRREEPCYRNNGTDHNCSSNITRKMSSSREGNGDHKMNPVVSMTETQSTPHLSPARSQVYPVALTMGSQTQPVLSKAKSQTYSVESRAESRLSGNLPFKCDRKRCVFLSLHAQEGFEPAFPGVHVDKYKEDADDLEQWTKELEEENQEKEKHPESPGEMISRIRLSTWYLVATLLLAIPTVLSFTWYRDVHAHGVAFRGIMLWIDISWIATLAGYLIVSLLSLVWDAICNLFENFPYLGFIESVRAPITVLLATIVAWSTTPLICRLSESECSASWYHILRKVFHVSIPVAAILLLERIFMSIVVCNAGSQILQKRWATLRSYRLAIYMLTIDWCRPTVKLVAHAMKALFLCQWCCVECMFGELRKRARRFRKHQQFLFRWKYLLIRRRSLKASTDMGLYWKGEGDDLDFSHNGQDLLTREFNKIKAFTDSRDTFHEEFVEEHIIIWDQQAPIYERRVKKEKIFELLGEEREDHTWYIRRTELFATYCDVCRAFRNINKAWNGAEEASRAVNAVLTLGILIIIALIYGQLDPFTNFTSLLRLTHTCHSCCFHRKTWFDSCANMGGVYRGWLRTRGTYGRVYIMLHLRLLQAPVRRRRHDKTKRWERRERQRRAHSHQDVPHVHHISASK